MFKNIFASAKENFIHRICPIALGASVCYACMRSLYEPLSVLYSIIFAFSEYFLFIVFDELKKRKFIGGTLYTLMLLSVLSLSVNLTRAGVTQLGFLSPMLWFYGSDRIDTYQPLFINSFFIGGGFFLTSVLYYFTQVRFRMAGLMLCILFPFVIYAKRMETMPEALVTIIITLFLAAAVHNKIIENSGSNKKNFYMSSAYILSIAVFVSLTSAAALSIKKPVYFSELEKNSSYFDNIASQGYNMGGYYDLTLKSSSRTGGHSFTDIPLFYVDDGQETGKSYFLRRQAYDTFDGDLWESKNTDYLAYSSEYPEYGNDDAVYDSDKISEFKNNNILSPYPEIKKLRVFDENFRSAYLPAPLGTITDDLPAKELKYVKYRQNSVILRLRSWEMRRPKPLDDTFSYIDFGKDIYKYAESLDLSAEDYTDILEKEASEGSIEAYRLISDYETARKNYTNTLGVSEKLKNLSSEIVSKCNSDIEKAYALENYFKENGYKYSLEYVPAEKSIDYFVFESKTGFCANYATAMTLMARSVGLPARYVEGFSAIERTEEGYIVVRDSSAHAITEVYIPAVGWLTFDPTVSAQINGEGSDDFDFVAFASAFFDRFFIAIIIIFLAIIFIFFKSFNSILFYVKIQFAPPDKKIIMIYKKLVDDIGSLTKKDCRTYTVKMVENLLLEKDFSDIHDFFELYEKTAFGNYRPSAKEFDDFFSYSKKHLSKRNLSLYFKK